MKKIIVSFILSVLSLTANAEQHNSYYNGNKLYSQILGDTLSQLQATTYVMGAVDMLMPVYCIPDNTTVGKLVEQVRKSLQDNPAERHRPAADFIVFTLKKEYSCKKENSKPDSNTVPPLEDRLQNPRPNKTFI